VLVALNLRGTGRSGGLFDHAGSDTIEDVRDAIEWLAVQPWCDGKVGDAGAVILFYHRDVCDLPSIVAFDSYIWITAAGEEPITSACPE